jgi:hypothetical protein
MNNLLPYLLCLIDLGCALQYGCAKDWPRVGYWVSAAVLTFSTTRMH